jgi:hypothetical protein
MTGSNMRSNLESSEQSRSAQEYYRLFGGPDAKLDWTIRIRPSLSPSPSNPASDSPSIWQQLPSLAQSLQAVLLAAGLVYAMFSMMAEFEYADGYSQMLPASAVEELRDAGEIFPFDHRFRTASALWLSEHAAANHDRQWEAAALPEVNQALKADPTSADLLRYRRMFEGSVK